MAADLPAWGRMVDMRPGELMEHIRKTPIVYVPSGIYEWHDDHLPMATDTLKMEEIAARAASLTGGVVHMPSYIGVGAFYGPRGRLAHGGVNFDEEMVVAYLTNLCVQLEAMGFRLIVLLYGHTNGGNINAHERVAAEYAARKNAAAKILAVNDASPVVRFRYKVADHAAKWETSLMMASHPDLVRMDDLPEGNMDWWGLDPRVHATSAEGERMYGLIVEATVRLVSEALDADRTSLPDATAFPRRSRCWEQCANISDLEEGYWQGDPTWEDPCCYFCSWRSPGIVDNLLRIKGEAWVEALMQRWGQILERPDGFQWRTKQAIEELRKEWESLRK